MLVSPPKEGKTENKEGPSKEKRQINWKKKNDLPRQKKKWKKRKWKKKKVQKKNLQTILKIFNPKNQVRVKKEEGVKNFQSQLLESFSPRSITNANGLYQYPNHLHLEMINEKRTKIIINRFVERRAEEKKIRKISNCLEEKKKKNLL